MDQALDLETKLNSSLKCEGALMSPEEFVHHWSSISAAMDKIPLFWSTHWTKEALYDCVVGGRYQVWRFGRSGTINVVVFTEIVDYPANRILRIPLIFGNSLDEVLPIMEATILDRYAAEAGCKYCESVGRPGWERKVPRFKRVGVLLRCEIEKKRIH